MVNGELEGAYTWLASCTPPPPMPTQDQIFRDQFMKEEDGMGRTGLMNTSYAQLFAEAMAFASSSQ